MASRWLPLIAVLLIGCSDDAIDEPPFDSTTDDSAGEAFDATLDGGVDAVDATSPDGLDTAGDDGTDASLDATIDDAIDAIDAIDAADDTIDATVDATDTMDATGDGPDTDAVFFDVRTDIAYDSAYTPPPWSPVCVPPPPPPRPDAGPGVDAADADADETLADTDVDAAIDGDAGADAGADATDDADDGASDVADTSDASLPDTAGCTAVRVRIVASNLTTGGSPTYEAPGIRILQGLHPDIALMQEFKHGPGLRALVDTAFGPTFNYVNEISPGSIPNGIVSRYPIIESGEWDDPDLTDRDWVWARIDVPGPIDLYAVSTHLRTTSATARDAEARNLVAYAKAQVPPGAYLVIAGDFNTAAYTTEPALFVLSEIVDVLPPYAVDQAGNPSTNAPRNKPYDWVMPSPSLYARMIPVTIGSAWFPAGLVFDSRVFSPLTDVSPVLSTDSAATNMQHMAVVRDFALGD